MCDHWKVKRGVHYSDELTDEDYNLFKSPLPSETQDRFKRALPAPAVSKQNATRYCTDKIKNTKLGKLCADIGVDVQGYVDSCSLDVSVSRLSAEDATSMTLMTCEERPLNPRV